MREDQKVSKKYKDVESKVKSRIDDDKARFKER